MNRALCNLRDFRTHAFLFSFFFFFFFLAASCSMRDLSSPTRDQTHAPGNGSAES